ncbi:hypothetical protein ABZ858_00130 [Streptomyces sp. NPDC047017]|uniref:hypothetical protein n=1 Tax=Streptomyces sp. NPDC047017 TaxID=3155024 RepID=UPI0033F01CC0
MTFVPPYTGKQIDVDRLTASTITDDDLDSLRAELRHYRERPAAVDVPPGEPMAPRAVPPR